MQNRRSVSARFTPLCRWMENYDAGCRCRLGQRHRRFSVTLRDRLAINLQAATNRRNIDAMRKTPTPNTASAHGTLASLKPTGATATEGFLAPARDFVVGVQLLANGPSDAAYACMLLAAQALECALKASLASGPNGLSSKQLRDQFGHDLQKLWREASARNLNIGAEPPGWCEVLNKGHNSPYYFRYRENLNSFNLHLSDDMVRGVERVLALVEHAVRQQ